MLLEDTPYGTALNVSSRGGLFAQAGERRTFHGDFVIDVRSRHPNGQIDYNLWIGGDPKVRDNDLGAVWVFVRAEVPGSLVRIFLLIDINGIGHNATLETSQNGWQVARVSASAVVP